MTGVVLRHRSSRVRSWMGAGTRWGEWDWLRLG
jgi:hypothetical protein